MNRFIVILLIGFTTSAVLAGEYKLTKGQGIEVCEAYKKNLNLSKPKMPTTCLRSAHEELGFSVPNWETFLGNAPIPGEINMPDKIDRFLWARDANPVYDFVVTEWPNWRGTKAQRELAWKGFKINRNRRLAPNGPLYAEFDIDNDGQSEPVYFERGCGTSFGSLILVLKQDYSDLDYSKTELVMPHPSRKEAGWGEFRKLAPGERATPTTEKFGYVQNPDSLHSAHYGVFFFKKKAYFDLWWRKHPDYQGQPDFKVGRLHVYLAEQRKSTEICTYRFDREKVSE